MSAECRSENQTHVLVCRLYSALIYSAFCILLTLHSALFTLHSALIFPGTCVARLLLGARRLGRANERSPMNYRFISTRMHGMMDYLTAFTLPFVSRVMGWETPVRNMHDCVAGTTGFLAATTDFEPGMVKAIPV